MASQNRPYTPTPEVIKCCACSPQKVQGAERQANAHKRWRFAWEKGGWAQTASRAILWKRRRQQVGETTVKFEESESHGESCALQRQDLDSSTLYVAERTHGASVTSFFRRCRARQRASSTRCIVSASRKKWQDGPANAASVIKLVAKRWKKLRLFKLQRRSRMRPGYCISCWPCVASRLVCR